MPKDTKTLGNNKTQACESLGFAHKKRGYVCFDTPSLYIVCAYFISITNSSFGTRTFFIVASQSRLLSATPTYISETLLSPFSLSCSTSSTMLLPKPSTGVVSLGCLRQCQTRNNVSI